MKKAISSFILTLILVVNVFAQEVAMRKQQYNLNQSGLGIRGYDPVAYFVNHQAVEGKKEIATVYKGITYRFASFQNRDIFKRKPQMYEPQYGGWCAYAMGLNGEKVEVDPQTFKILNGRLYLFYNKYFNNTLKQWNKNEAYLKASADRNWTKFIY